MLSHHLLFYFQLALATRNVDEQINSSTSDNFQISRELGADFEHSSHFLMTSSSIGLESDWLHQWPIGNGEIGALVGGSYLAEVIPLSMEGFYVTQHKDTINAIISGTRAPINHKNYVEARNSLNNGDFLNAEAGMRQLQSKSEIGMFQYICDLTFVFQESPFLGSRKAETAFDPSKRMGRSKLIEELFSITKSIGSYSSSPSFSALLASSSDEGMVSRSVLDTAQGVVKSTYAQPRSTTKHNRLWFASAVDDVIVGRLRCSHNDKSKWMAKKDGCLHFALRLSRHMNTKSAMLPETQIRVTSWTKRMVYEGEGEGAGGSNSNPGEDPLAPVMFGQQSEPSSHFTAISLSLHASVDRMHPLVEVCGAVICVKEDHPDGR